MNAKIAKNREKSRMGRSGLTFLHSSRHDLARFLGMAGPDPAICQGTYGDWRPGQANHRASI